MRPRLAVFLAALLGIALVSCANAPILTATPGGLGAPWTVVYPPRADYTIALSPQAEGAVQGLALVSYGARVELAACVARWRVVPPLADARERTHIATIIYVDSIGPAGPFESDSLHIRGSGLLCPSGDPVVHTHIVPNAVLYEPSPVDMEAAKARSAPFDLLISAPGPRTWLLTLYALRR